MTTRHHPSLELDDIQAARDHGDLADGPFAAIADKLESTLGKYGLERFGAKGEVFDPNEHEAMAQTPLEGAEPGTVIEVYQSGYRINGAVLRPARVVVAG